MKNYSSKDPSSIQTLFSHIAPDYDKVNTLLSFSLHKRWNVKLKEQVLPLLTPSSVYLDLCAGTGEISLGLLQKGATPKEVLLLDFCKEMLQVAEKKIGHKFPLAPTKYLVKDALATDLPDKSVDVITIAYGVRNVVSTELLFQELLRILKPGGSLFILELTRPEKKWLSKLHALYLKTFVPLIGKLAAKDRRAYQYLASSIQHFPSSAELAYALQKKGFCEISYEEVSFGIASLITCEKKRSPYER